MTWGRGSGVQIAVALMNSQGESQTKRWRGWSDCVAITKEWILRELLDNAELAKADGSWAARNRSLELVGKEIGIFGDQPPPAAPTRLEDLPTSILEQNLA
jgi:hypothetical protein